MKTIQEQHQNFYLIRVACRSKPKLKIFRHFFVIFYALGSKKNMLIKMEIHRVYSAHEATETFQRDSRGEFQNGILILSIMKKKTIQTSI